MDTELLSVAKELAERGWLPGIVEDTVWLFSEADLNLAATSYITDPKRGWDLRYVSDVTSIVTHAEDGITKPQYFQYPRTTTLSLLRALLAACEAAEAKR